MNKTKIWLIVAASLILVGSLIFGGIMMALKWDFSKLSTVKYKENTFESAEAVQSISITADTADISFKVSENENCKVVCFEEEKSGHSVSVEDGVLTISLEQSKKWYDHIGINFASSRITVYLPAGQYDSIIIHENTGDITIPEDFSFDMMDISLSTGDVRNCASAGNLKIKGSTGDIYLENIASDAIDLSVSTGHITGLSITCTEELKINVSTGKTQLTDVFCGALLSTGSTGKIALKNVIASGEISIKRTTGDVTFNQCDAAEIFIKASTGQVSGSLLSPKIFLTETSTGDILVPQSLTGGKCQITTSTGDIEITYD